ncbi:MAG: alpha-amylase family protein [Oryzihumus sp.]
MTRAPESVHSIAAATLGDLPDDRLELFRVRLDRWWTDLWHGLRGVYSPAATEEVAKRLVVLAATAYRERDPEPHRLDLERMLQPDWFQCEQMLGYAAYTERFAGDLDGVRKKIPYLEELGVTYLHLMPLLLPRDGDNDGGYAVADYRRVRPDLGSVGDLRELASALRRSGISLCLDLVLNHVAREHEWAVLARQGSEKHRAYFHLFPDRREPDAYEQTLPEVFPDFAPGSFTWDDEVDAWVWTTFNAWQWDLNWANPDVLAEFADIMLFLANLGVEVLRLDAIAFLWKRLGTTCQNQPEVHHLTQALRAVMRIACPATVFKAEAIVSPRDLVQYLGQGSHHGKVSDLAYHNALMVQVWSMLAAKDVRLAAHTLGSLPPAPTTSAWITYVRCHDDIGWAVDDRDAAAMGLSGHAHRAFLSDWYTGDFDGSPARGLTFQLNPATGDRRVSGTTASLIGLEAALEQAHAPSALTRRDPADPAPDTADVRAALARVRLVHAIVMGWGGVPVIWSGDELGQPNDPHWADEPGHADDNRWAHRPRLDRERAHARHDPGTVPGAVFESLAHLAAVRCGLPHLHATVRTQVLPVADPGVLGTVRRHPLGALVALYNVTDTWRAWPADWVADEGVDDPYDAIGAHRVQPGEDGNLWLPPYAAWWLVQHP